MKKGFDISALTAAIHLIAVLSIECFAAIFLTFGILAIPALTSAFLVGKDVIYKRFNVYDSLTKSYFRQLKEQMGMMRYFPLQLIIIIQGLGIYAANRLGYSYLIYVILPCTAFLMTLIIYLITYHVFYESKPNIVNVIIAMFYKVQYLITIWIAMLLVLYLLSTPMSAVFLIAGEILLLLFETAAFLGITSYKKAKGELSEETVKYFGEDILKKL